MNAFAEILEAIAHAPIEKRPMTNHGVLNEAYAYAKPSSFSRGMRIDIGGGVILLAYAIHKMDPVFIAGQAGGLVVYARNLFLIFREKGAERRVSS